MAVILTVCNSFKHCTMNVFSLNERLTLHLMNEKGGIPPIEGGISSLQSRTHDQKLWEDQKGLVKGNTHGIYCSPNSYSEIGGQCYLYREN